MSGGEIQDFYLKILLLGEGGVGKSSLILQFVENKFTDQYKVSLGADFLGKTLVFGGEDGNPRINVNLQIWDIAGQSKFSSFRKLYYTGVAGVLLVFDLTKRSTLAKLVDWSNDVDDFSPGAVKVLLGNKIDLSHLREVDEEESNSYKSRLKAEAILETSAKTGEGVNEAFKLIAETVLTKQNKL